MNPFTYSRVSDAPQAIAELSSKPRAKLLGGGTNLVDLMKMGVETPEQIIDINRLELDRVEELPEGKGLRIGGLARNSDVAAHPLIKEHFPVLSEALLAGASPQLRNRATTGGNLLQRTRCPYFYDPDFPSCNKRLPGSGCGAVEGFNRMHAILGQSDQCIATHPSDMCVALAALDAIVTVRGSNGIREIAFRDFHRLPGNTPEHETNLSTDEIILAVDLPSQSFTKNSNYLKIRDRDSYAFALVSVAAALEVQDGKIKNVRIALGGVAHKPWRAFEAEKNLLGKSANESSFKTAADMAFAEAKGYRHNTFKIELARRSIVRALNTLVAKV